MAVSSMTREALDRSIAEFRTSPTGQRITADREANRRAMLERRARYSPEELARLDREFMQKLEAWAHGEVP